MMDFVTFIRKPFKIQAVEVTKKNISELSHLVGDGRVRKKDNGFLFFVSDPQLIRNISRVEVGFWVTKMDDQFRVYKPEVFTHIFVESTPERSEMFDLIQEMEETDGRSDETPLQLPSA